MSDLVQVKKIPGLTSKKVAERRPSELRQATRLLSRFLAGQRREFLLALLMLIAEAWSATRVPLVLGFLIDYLTRRIALLGGASVAAPLSPLQIFGLGTIFNPDIDTLAVVTIGIVLLTLLNSATDSLAEIYLARGGRLLGYHLRVGLYSHLQKLSLAFFGRQRTGDLLTRVTGDVAALEEFVIRSLSDIVGSFLLIGFILYTMIVGAWQVAIIAALIIPFMALVSNYFSQRIKAASKQQRAQEGQLASAAQEMLSSIRVIQTYGSGGGEAQRFAEQSRKTMDTALEAARLQAIFSATVSTLESVAVALVIWLAVYLIFGSFDLISGFGVAGQGFTLGTLTVFTKYIADMFKPTKKIIKEWGTFGKIYASVERIGELMDRAPAVQDAPTAVAAPRLRGHVAFDQVSFAYVPDPEDLVGEPVPAPLALRSISFTIEPSQVVALVGGSGAGKSTIAQLLPRLYDPQAGAVLIDGRDIRGYTLDSLRSQMSMVLQEAVLFTGSVAENIAYGRPGATRAEIIAAATQANAHDFILALPDGYDTELSERASNLSGGQRQRIAIARAFIRNAPILILDEPTTGLDAEASEQVLLALRQLMRGKATLIISHDLNLIRQADKIIVIKAGAIEQMGGHAELLAQGGIYATLYQKQFGHMAAEHALEARSRPAAASRLPVVTPPTARRPPPAAPPPAPTPGEAAAPVPFAALPGWLVAATQPELLIGALERTVPAFATGALQIRRCKLDRARLRGDGWDVLYTLTLGGMGADQERTTMLAGRLAPALRDPQAAASWAGTFGTAEWVCTLPELGLELRCAPADDAALAALPALANAEQARKLIEAGLRARGARYAGLRIRSITPQIVRHKSGSRCTMQYRIEYSGSPRNIRRWPAQVFAKTYSHEQGQATYEAMRKLWASPLAGSKQVTIAEPLAYLPEQRLLVQGPVSGEQSLKDLLRLALRAPTPAPLAGLLQAVRRTGAGLAALHGAGVHHGVTVTWEDELAEVRGELEKLRAVAPEFAEAMLPLLASLERLAAATPAGPLLPAHRSFRPQQILIQRERVGFIDFDGLCMAEPALDIALLRATIKELGINTAASEQQKVCVYPSEAAFQARLAQLNTICENFLAEYERAGAVSRQRVALWEALDLLTVVLRCWSKVKPHQLGHAVRLLDAHLRGMGLR